MIADHKWLQVIAMLQQQDLLWFQCKCLIFSTICAMEYLKPTRPTFTSNVPFAIYIIEVQDRIRRMTYLGFMGVQMIQVFNLPRGGVGASELARKQIGPQGELARKVNWPANYLARKQIGPHLFLGVLGWTIVYLMTFNNNNAKICQKNYFN